MSSLTSQNMTQEKGLLIVKNKTVKTLIENVDNVNSKINIAVLEQNQEEIVEKRLERKKKNESCRA